MSGELEEAITAALRGAAGPVSTRDIVDAVDRPFGVVLRRLVQMHHDGRVARFGHPGRRGGVRWQLITDTGAI